MSSSPYAEGYTPSMRSRILSFVQDFAQHKTWCAVLRQVISPDHEPESCNCGFDFALKALTD